MNFSKQIVVNERPPAKGVSLVVALCHINSVSSFFVQKQGAKAKQLVETMNNLQHSYNTHTTESLNLLCPAIGVYCAAKFSEDNQWYRGQIMSSVENSAVKVKYIDYGNVEEVMVWNLRKLMDKHLLLPAQAIHCCLADVCPSDLENGWSVEAAKFIAEVGGDRRLRMVVKELEDDTTYVKLDVIGQEYDVNINSMLVKKGLGECTGPSSMEEDIVYHTSDGRPTSSNADGATDQSYIPDVEPSRRVKNKKVQNLRRREIRNKTNPPTSVPSVSVPVQPEHIPAAASAEAKPKSKKSEYIPIVVTHVQSPVNLYIRLKFDSKLNPELSKMMHDIQAEYNQVVETGNVEWKVNDPCCVKNSKDSLWYRACIQEISEDQKKFQVLLVDYGPTISVAASKVSILLDEFQVKNAFCMQCHLVGITPAGDGKTWSKMACEYLTELTEKYEDETYFMYNKNAEKKASSIPVDLYIQEIVIGGALEPTKKSFINVARKLVDEGLALPLNGKFLTTTPPAEAPAQCDKDSKPDRCPSPVPEEVPEVCLKSWKPALKVAKKVFQCKPTYIDENARIYLHDTVQAASKLKVLTDAMQMQFSDSKPKAHDLYWLPGQICIAKFHVDQLWYRGQVISIEEAGIKVQFVDYGNEEMVNHKDLRKDVIMLDLPIQCTCCEIFGIQPITEDGKWQSKVLDFIHKSIVEKICTVTIENYPAENEIPKISIVIGSDMDLKKLLLDARCAMEKEENEIVVESVAYEDIEDTSVKAYPPAYIPEINEVIPVVVTQMITPCQVSIQKLEHKEGQLSDAQFEINTQFQRFLEIMKEMRDNAKNWPLMSNIQEGTICCGQYTHDDTWYRAEILKVMGDNQFLVIYVDYGNCEILNGNRMRALPPAIKDFPVQAILCTLHQLTFCGEEWSAETSAEMMNIFFNSEHTFYAKIKCKSPEVKIDLLIKDKEDFKLAYQSLIDKGMIALIREKLPQELL